MRSTPFELALPRDVNAPGIARRTLNEWFATSFADDDAFATAKLLASELVTNAVLHGQGTITIRADLDEDRLLVEVMDEGTGFERTVRDGDLEKIGGWGLGLVDSESSRWGIQEGTTHVSFELERSGPDSIPRSNLPFEVSRNSEPAAAPESTAHPHRARECSLARAPRHARFVGPGSDILHSGERQAR